jgi:isopenicillin N synthase-like dioxygenase
MRKKLHLQRPGLQLIVVFQMPDGQPGLQVYLPRAAVPDAEPVDTNHNSEYTFEGEWGWYNAPIPPPGGFLINVGLAMELWSGGAYKATLHRVVFPPAKEGEGLQGRYSVTYFVQPDDQVVRPASSSARDVSNVQEIRPVLQGGANVKEGEPVTSKDLFGGKLKESLERIKNMPERSA